VNNFLSYSKCSKCHLCLHALSRPLSEIWKTLLIGPAENCPISSPCDFQFSNCCWLLMKLSIKFVHRSQTWCLKEIHIWREFGDLCSFSHLQTVCMQEFLSVTCNVCRAKCISLNLPLAPSDSRWYSDSPSSVDLPTS